MERRSPRAAEHVGHLVLVRKGPARDVDRRPRRHHFDEFLLVRVLVVVNLAEHDDGVAHIAPAVAVAIRMPRVVREGTVVERSAQAVAVGVVPGVAGAGVAHISDMIAVGIRLINLKSVPE